MVCIVFVDLANKLLSSLSTGSRPCTLRTATDCSPYLELADDATVVVVSVAGLLAAEQFECVQPLSEPVELRLGLELRREDLYRNTAAAHRSLHCVSMKTPTFLYDCSFYKC